MTSGTTHEVAAVARVFEDPLLARKNDAQQFWNGHALDADALLAAAAVWSSGERHLALLAAELWGHDFAPAAPRFRIVDAVCALDDRHVTTILEAVARRAGMPVPLPLPR